MTKDIFHGGTDLGTAHLDAMKSNSEFSTLAPYFEFLLDENAFSSAQKIVNLFAGNCNESQMTSDYLHQQGNANCMVVAVDRTHPTYLGNVDQLKQNQEVKFEFVKQDAVEYLKSLTDASVDVITAFGAEYVFRRNPDPLAFKTYLQEVQRVLKNGGFLVSPMISSPGTANGFQELMPGTYQKKDPLR